MLNEIMIIKWNYIAKKKKNKAILNKQPTYIYKPIYSTQYTQYTIYDTFLTWHEY